MTTVNYTPLLGLALPTTGDLSGIWGVEVNNAITSLTDTAIAGTVSLTIDADVTLTATNGSADQARNAIIVWAVSGGTVTRTITAPAKSKIYTVINTSATQSLVVNASGPTAGITVAPSEKCVIAWSSSAADFVKVASSEGGAISGVVPPDHGGTGQSSYAVGDTLYASGVATISKLPIGASTYMLTSTGTAPQWSDPDNVAVGNLRNGAALEIPYQSAPNTTAFIPAPTVPGYVLGWNGAGFAWQSAPAATSATNLAGGAANRIAYQTAPGVTGFIPAPGPTAFNVSLLWTGTGFSWSAAPLGTVTYVNIVSSTGLTFTGGPVTNSGTFNLTGTLVSFNGGTGRSVLSAGAFLRGGGPLELQVRQGNIYAGSGISISDNGTDITISNTTVTPPFNTNTAYFACQFG